MTAQHLGIYDENIFYHWTLREWSNRIKGARLAEIDQREVAIQAAVVSGHVSRMASSKAKTPPVKSFFNAKEARELVLHGVKKEKPKADFTIYEKLKESMKDFQWSSSFKPKSKK